MGIACGPERGAGAGCRVESSNRAGRRCRGVVASMMTRGVKLRAVRGQDTSRRGATEHAKFSKWDCDFMLQPSTPWVGAELDLSGRESFDDYHGTAALGTDPRGAHALDR